MSFTKKIYVLRVQSLVSSEDSTLRYGGSEAEIVIPLVIIKELGKLAKEFTAKGQNARKFLDYLETFKMSQLKSKEGVRQRDNSILRIEDGYHDVDIPLKDLNYTDHRCFQIAIGLKKTQNKQVILVSKSSSIRLMAKYINITARPSKDDIFPALNEQYTGRVEVETSKVKLDRFYQKGEMPKEDIYKNTSIEWMPNLFLKITANDSNSSAIARFDGEKIVSLKYKEYHPYGITPQNAGQTMLLEALLTPPDIAPIVIAKGGAGTGKTFASIAVALEQTTEKDPIYSQILITAPVETIGQEKLGFLPGDLGNKFNPYINGINDNIRILLHPKKERGNSNKIREDGQYFFEKGIIQLKPIGFLRGSTVVDKIFIIDETQNIKPDDIKSIVTRAGKGSKFVFLGDPTQIDNPSLNERYNGLVYLSEKMKDSPLAWQVTFNENESVRSELAKYAAQIL